MTDAPDLEPAALEAAATAVYEAMDIADSIAMPEAERYARAAVATYLAARSAPEAGKAVDELALIAEMLTALKQSAAQFSQYTKHRRLTADEQFAFDSARLAIAKFEANR